MTISRTLLLLGALLIVLGATALYTSHKTVQAPSALVSTETVPTMVDPSWLAYSDVSVSFQYPAELPTTYIHANDWPPKVAVSEPGRELECTVGTGDRGVAERKTVAGRQYCVTTLSDGAAGSMYNTYEYSREEGSRVISVAFVLRLVQCGNYDYPQKTACEKERSSFNVDTFADTIAQTVTLK